MKTLNLLLILGLIGLNASCLQTYNSSSSDKFLYGAPNVDTSTSFGQAFQIIQSRCVACHVVFGNYTTEEDWKNSTYNGMPLVVAQDPTNSLVLYVLFGAGERPGQEQMPPAPNPSLTNQEITTIRTWINEMSP